MNRLTVVKIGGNVIDHSEKLTSFLKEFSALEGFKILVHGGGKIASKLSADLGIEAKMIEGRRITDEESLRIVTMVYAGLINKNIVAQLQAARCNAIGLSGADGNLIKAVKRPLKLHPSGSGKVDYGFAGDLDERSVDSDGMKSLLDGGFVPVFSAITHDGNGQLLNTNADTIASVIAVAMSRLYDTRLVYCFEKNGVLADVNDETSVISNMIPEKYTVLKNIGSIYEGMIPKLDNAFEALNDGVSEVIIGSSAELNKLTSESFGTHLTLS